MYNKQKALDTALSQIEKAFGKGSVMKLGAQDAVDVDARSERSTIIWKPTGCRIRTSCTRTNRNTNKAATIIFRQIPGL